MYEYSFGEVLQTLRKNQNISIDELTEGICSESDYLCFEQEKKYPTFDQLYLLSEKLNTNLGYVLNMITKSNDNYVALIKNLIKKYKRERNYGKVYEIIQKEKLSPIFNSNKLSQFLLWNEGVCLYYLFNNKEQALFTLNEAISLTNPKRVNLNESEIEILTSLAMIVYETADYEHSIFLFKEALQNLENLPTLLDPKVKLRILFGLSQALTEEGEYHESLKYSKQGIDICVEEELLYLFAECHYQTGENYFKLGDVAKGRNYVEEAIHLCYLTKQVKMAEIIQVELEKMLNRC